jgi:nitric oxide dioxygenase
MVGDCLLRAMREVLGPEIATEQVIEAWGAAYGQLAEILIGAEAGLYDAKAKADGGWRGTRKFVLARRVDESEEITSFYLAPEDGNAILAHAPGQYIGLRVVIDGAEMRRQYSLSNCHHPHHYRISVKREAGGKVSNFLHDQLQVGHTIELYPPAGDFILRDSRKPLVLISGGVGLTPLLAMLEAALPSGRPVLFIHAARHGGVHAFRQHIDALAQQHPQLQRFFCYEQQRAQDPAAHAYGWLDRERLADWLPQSTDLDAYFVGPKAFMQAIRQHLHALGIPPAQSHYEFFGPAASLA